MRYVVMLEYGNTVIERISFEDVFSNIIVMKAQAPSYVRVR